MKPYNKNFLLILILICTFILIGCSNFRVRTFKDPDNLDKNDDNNESVSGSTPTPTPNLDEEDISRINLPDDNVISTTPDEDIEISTFIQPVENRDLLIYVVDNSTELEAVTALVPTDIELTPQVIIDTLIDSMADQSLIIGVESVTTEEDTVIVSFYPDKPPLASVGSGLEEAILNAIAQSLTYNLDNYHKVIYRVEGGPYISGHIELGIDEVYFED